MSVLRLPRAVYEAIRAHGEKTYPRECCGALLGHSAGEDWLVEAAVPASNTHADSAQSRYNIAPAELVKIVCEARSLGLETAGFYHSHPDHPAQCSATDFAEAHWLGCSYVITEVSGGKAAVTNAFLLAGTTEEDKRFEPQDIQLVDLASDFHRK